MDKTQLIVFFDAVGRTIFAERVVDRTTDKQLVVKNPVVVHAQPEPGSGKLTLQLFPAFFREFLAEKDADTVWTYNKDVIAIADDATFDFKLIAQYEGMFQPAGGSLIVPARNLPPSGPNSPVVSLFDN